MEITVRKIILLSQKDKYGSCAIYVEIHRQDNHKYKRINTEIRVNPANWSKKKAEVLKNDTDFQYKNNAVDLVYNQILSYSLSQSTEFKAEIEQNYPQLKELFPENTSKKKYLTDYFEDYIELRKLDGSSRGTWKEYITVKNRLIKYEEFINKKLSFTDINLTFSDSFGIWMFIPNKVTPHS